MSRHLKGCGSGKAAGAAQNYHLFVEGRYAKAYWMHLAVAAGAPLEALDGFLRNVWLECCGHMSAFTIGGERYSIHPMREFQERGMRTTLGKVLSTGAKFSYEYDFGSTTELSLKVVGRWAGEIPRGGIRLLARNEAPRVPCDRCGAKAAAQICTECAWEGEAWFCEECAASHECGEDMLLPVVNSPRVGVCGYSG